MDNDTILKDSNNPDLLILMNRYIKMSESVDTMLKKLTRDHSSDATVAC